MTKITIEIETENAAFEDNPGEFDRILRTIMDSDCIEDLDGKPLFDGNGNSVGKVNVN